MGERVPQAVQNLVIRDYCKKKGFEFLLSSTEYAMQACHLILEKSIETISEVDGIAMYSIFQLPEKNDYRKDVCQRVIKLDKQIHFACEGLSLSSENEFEDLETLWMIKKTIPRCPTGLPLLT
jgi:sporadic carbohydrate cluster protein (TIGR04323 family)